MTPEQYEKLTPREQAAELAKVAKETANRCIGNILLEGTWVQESFDGLSERLSDLVERLKSAE